MSRDEPRELNPIRFGPGNPDLDFRPKPETPPKAYAVEDAAVEVVQNPPLNPLPPATEQQGKAPSGTLKKPSETSVNPDGTPTEGATSESEASTELSGSQSDSSLELETSLTPEFPWLQQSQTSEPASSMSDPASETPVIVDSESAPSEKPKPENN